MTVQNHYKVLGVLDTAEISVIKAAYKALVQIYHPDKFNTSADKEAATAKVKQINEAYRVLSDPKLREAYDRELASQNDAYDEEVKQDENTNEYRQKNHALDQSWDFAKQFVENLDGIYESLALISNDLAFTFKLTIMKPLHRPGK